MRNEQHHRPAGDDADADPLELFRLASEAMDNEEYEEAIERARQALENELTGEELANQFRAMIAYCHYQADRYEEALDWYRQAGDEVEMTDDEYYAYAYTLYREEEYIEANLALDLISEEFQDDAAVLMLRGVVLYNFDEPDYQTVLDYLQRAAEKKPDRSEDYLIAECLRKLERFEESYPYYRKAIGNKPDNPRLYYFYGLALLLGGHIQEAIAAMKESAERDDQQADVHLNLARVLVAEERKEEALDHIEKAIALGDPDARELLRQLMEGEQETGEDDSEYEWEEEEEEVEDPAQQLHPLAQDTMYSIRHRFPMKLIFMLAGLTLGLVVVIGVIFSEYERVPGPPPVIEDTMRTQLATAFTSLSQFAEGERRIEITLPLGTELKPIARYGYQILVELPDGQRGLVDANTLNRFYDVTLRSGTRLYSEPHGMASSGEVGEDGARAINLSSIDELRNQRQQVRLVDGGTITYVQSGSMRREIYHMRLPVVNRRNKRLYQLERLEQSLAGADINQVTRRLGIPTGRLIDRASSQTIYLFPLVMIADQKQRWSSTAVVMEDDRVTRIVPQGEPRSVAIDQFTPVGYFQATGLPNLFLQAAPWFVVAETDWISRRLDQLKEWSRTVGWIVHIIVILIFIALVLMVLYSLFGLPLLLSWPLVFLAGKTTRLPNGLLKLMIWLLLAAGFTGFYFLSLAAFDISYGNFILTVYGIVLFVFFLRMGQQATEYLDASRCNNCRVWKSVDLLGSLYLGYDRSVSYERVYTGKSTSWIGNTEYHHYEDRPRYSYTYYYQDFFNCGLCGNEWWTKESAHRKRADMDHSRVPA